MEALPDEMVLRVLGQLDSGSLAAACQVCSRWRALGRRPALWRDRRLRLDGDGCPRAELVLAVAPCLAGVTVGEPSGSQRKSLLGSQCEVKELTFTESINPTPSWVWSLLQNPTVALHLRRLSFSAMPLRLSPVIIILLALEELDVGRIEFDLGDLLDFLYHPDWFQCPTLDGDAHPATCLKHLRIDCDGLSERAAIFAPSIASLVGAHRASLERFSFDTRLDAAEPELPLELELEACALPEELLGQLLQCPKLRSVEMVLCAGVEQLCGLQHLDTLALQILSLDLGETLPRLPPSARCLRVEVAPWLSGALPALESALGALLPPLPALEELRLALWLSQDEEEDEEDAREDALMGLQCRLQRLLPGVSVSVRLSPVPVAAEEARGRASLDTEHSDSSEEEGEEEEEEELQCPIM